MRCTAVGVPFQHVLVATDFGSSSLRAIHLAAALAARLTARLTVLHVIQDAVYPVETPLTIPPPDMVADQERAAKHELDSFLERLPAGAGHGLVRFGDPAREIVAQAEESDCDLIVVGTHGRGRLARLLLGSTAEKVVRTSHVPVLSVRAESVAVAA